MVKLDDDAGRMDLRVRLTQRADGARAAFFGGSEVDKEDLVEFVVDDGGEFGTAPDEVNGGELAFEDGELQMISIASHRAKYLTKPLVVGDVVAYQVSCAHRMLSAEVAAGWRAEVSAGRDQRIWGRAGLRG